MAKSVDLTYDRLVAGERLSSSDKYEALAAIVFFALDEQATIHDMRLLGSSGVRHQIDAVVEADGEKKRTLIECKDYETKVGLPLVRNFFGAVEDLGPDEAFMVTTVGYTGPAKQYAEAKGIRLAIFRPPEDDEDWGNLIRRVHVKITPVGPTNVRFRWIAASSGEADGSARQEETRSVDPQTTRLRAPDGREELMADLCERIFGGTSVNTRGTVAGSETFTAEHTLILGDGTAWPVAGYEWAFEMVAGTPHTFSVGHGIGGMTAELVLRSLDGDLHRIFSNRQIAAYTLDGDGRVVPR